MLQAPFRASALLITFAFTSLATGTAFAEDSFAEEDLQALSYRLVGPFRGGRVTAVAGVPQQPATFYMGSTGGGVWKTTDGGLSWASVSDQRFDDDAGEDEESEAEKAPPPEPGDPFGSASVGAISVAGSDPNVVYVGMGSACIRGNTSPGDGVYKSTDAGRTWHHQGLPEAGQIGSVEVHPKNPDIVYVAALGHAFGPNPERGVFRSTDGGDTWEKVLYVSDRAGAVDLAMDPTNPRIIYAAFWQAERKPWTMISGGPGSGLWKTTDGGDTWEKLSKGLPKELGRIGVAVSPARPDRVWALVEAKEKRGLYRSDNGGKSFRLVSSDGNLIQRPWYYTHVFAHPKDENTVYVANVAFFRSDDGGENFKPIRTPHGDNHDLWINPDNPEIMVQANDGGANVSINGGQSWSTQANQPTAEMYRVSVDDQWPYWLYGGQQDNSAVAIPSRTSGSAIERQDWYAPGGCESAHVAVDPRNPDVSYAGCYGGAIDRYDRAVDQERSIMAYPQMAVGQKAEDLRYRFQWNAPIVISPHDPSVLYHTSQFVHRSTDEGQSWEVISPDLSRNDKSKQGYAGGDLTWDNTGVEVYGTVFALEESPTEPGLLWAGTDDGRIHLSRDNGESWTEVTPRKMPEWGTVNTIGLSRKHPGRALIAVHRYRQDDFRPYVFLTEDYGDSWSLLTNGRNGIPEDHFVRAVAEDPDRDGLLYAGSEFGMYVSFDDGDHWQSLQLNLPVTPITDLAVKDKDLVVATQGRSYWILDDLTPLHQISDETTDGHHLYAPREAYQFGGGGAFWRTRGTAGQNPVHGAWIFYHLDADLSEEDAEEVVLEIIGSDGTVIRKLSSQKAEPKAPNPWRRFYPEAFAGGGKLKAKAGLNRYVWNFRHHDAELVDDAVLWGSASGPDVPPGSYRARLTVGDWQAEVPIEVKMDPRLDVEAEAIEARYELAMKVHTALNDAHGIIKTIRSVREQVDGVMERLEEAGLGEGLGDAAKPLKEKLATLEKALNQTDAKVGQDVLNFPPKLDNQLVYLRGVVESADAGPTEGMVERFEDLSGELSGHQETLEGILETELAAFNELAAERQPAPVVVPDS